MQLPLEMLKSVVDLKSVGKDRLEAQVKLRSLGKNYLGCIVETVMSWSW